MIIDELLNEMEDELKDREAIDVRVGLGYTGVLLDNCDLGIAYTFRHEVKKCCETMDLAGELEGNAWELAKLAKNPYTVDSSIGVAAINAVANQEKRKTEAPPILDQINIGGDEKIGMVGEFAPLIGNFREVADLYVFDRNSQGEHIYPDWAAETILPKMDVCIITGSSIVNKTVDHLLELSSNAKEIIILGPTTTLSKKVFQNHNVTKLGGTVIEDVEKALKIISQGGGTRRLRETSRKVSINLNK